MLRFTRICAISLVVTLGACSTAPPRVETAAPPAANLAVTLARFGVFLATDDGRRILLEADRFPAIVSLPFGWFIAFNTTKPTVIWREELELPEPPASWGLGEALGVFTVSPDRRTAVTERITPSRLGFITNEWRYSRGDPTGAHVVRVYIDGQLAREFRFTIEPLPAESPTPPTAGHST